MELEINKVIIDSLGLPYIVSFDDFVQCLRLNPKLVYWLSSTSNLRYMSYEIPKRSGEKRRIDAPVYSLKQVQKWILYNILYKIKPTQFSYGFNRCSGTGSPLFKVAENHRYNLFLLKIDLKDFYPSLSRKKVYGLFRSIGYNSCVANILTNICTYNGSLPQGAVTSAHIANILCRRMDYRIAGYCEKHNISFSRYADDMTFSSDNRNDLKKAYTIILKIIRDEGLSVNIRKTHFMSPKCRKQVLGLTINDNQIKVAKQLKRKVRTMIHKSIVMGIYEDNDIIKGYISYIESIESGYTQKIKKYVEKLTRSPLCIYSNLVEKYNHNKLFKDLPDMRLHFAKDFNHISDEDDFYQYENELHEEYLINHNKE